MDTLKENKMGTEPVGRLLFKMALPMIISMIIQALYNIVDSIYVSQINENALTAVSISFSIQMLIIAISSGTMVGINALLSRSLGEKDFKLANRITQHGVFLGIAGGVLFAILSFIIVKPFMAVQTASAGKNAAQIYEYGCTYLWICCVMAIAIFMEFTFERLLNSTGKTTYTMISQTSGAVFNIIMDPILIFGYFGFPEMGIAGAAAATVSGQTLAAIIALVLNIRKNKEISLNMKGFRPDLNLIGKIYRIGVPSIIMMAIGSVMTFCMYQILMPFTSTAAAVFGVFFKLNSMVFNPIFGLNNAMIPIVAYNLGARHRLRIQQTVFYSRITAMVLMAVGTLLFWLIPDQLFLLFNASPDMLEIGRTALRIISISFIPAGFSIVTSSALQATGDAFYSMINSICRQLVILVPAAFLLSRLVGLDGVWWGFPIADVLSLIVIQIFYRRVYNQKIAPLPD